MPAAPSTALAGNPLPRITAATMVTHSSCGNSRNTTGLNRFSSGVDSFSRLPLKNPEPGFCVANRRKAGWRSSGAKSGSEGCATTMRPVSNASSMHRSTASGARFSSSSSSHRPCTKASANGCRCKSTAGLPAASRVITTRAMRSSMPVWDDRLKRSSLVPAAASTVADLPTPVAPSSSSGTPLPAASCTSCRLASVVGVGTSRVPPPPPPLPPSLALTTPSSSRDTPSLASASRRMRRSAALAWSKCAAVVITLPSMAPPADATVARSVAVPAPSAGSTLLVAPSAALLPLLPLLPLLTPSSPAAACRRTAAVVSSPAPSASASSARATARSAAPAASACTRMSTACSARSMGAVAGALPASMAQAATARSRAGGTPPSRPETCRSVAIAAPSSGAGSVSRRSSSRVAWDDGAGTAAGISSLLSVAPGTNGAASGDTGRSMGMAAGVAAMAVA